MVNFDKLKKRWQRDRIRQQEYSAIRKKLVKEKAKPVFEKYHFSKVVLFGSALENRSWSDSDIDLYVHPLSGSDYWIFIRELEEMVGIPVDVYTDSDDEIFVKKILERGETVYEIQH